MASILCIGYLHLSTSPPSFYKLLYIISITIYIALKTGEGGGEGGDRYGWVSGSG